MEKESNIEKANLTPLEKYYISSNKDKRILSRNCQDVWLHLGHNKVLD
jgi:hypothetical protein